jgi:hypothetical protein
MGAQKVCQPLNYRSLESDIRARHCAKQALERAVAAVNAPALTSYCLAQNGNKSRIIETATIAPER